MQKICVIGTLTKDPTITDTPDGKVIKIVLKSKNSKKQPIYHNCTQHRKQNQSIGVAETLTKDSKVYMEGEPSIEYFKEKNQQGEQAQIKINIRHIEIVYLQKNG